MTDWNKVRTALEELQHGDGDDCSKCPKCTLDRELLGEGTEEESERMTVKEILLHLENAGLLTSPDVDVVVRIDEEWVPITSVAARDILVDEGDTDTTACIVLDTG